MNTNEPECNAGFTIFTSEVYETVHKFDKTIHRRIVIGERQTKFGLDYVTWEHTEEIGYFWGHYFSDKNDALIDYHKRLLKHYDSESSGDW